MFFFILRSHGIFFITWRYLTLTSVNICNSFETKNKIDTNEYLMRFQGSNMDRRSYNDNWHIHIFISG